VDDHQTRVTGSGQHRGQGWDHLRQLAHVVPQQLAAPARLDEVALHVDHHQRGRLGLGLECDVLRGLDYPRSAGVVPDERVAEAIDLVVSKRDADGRWPL
jgi:hypothetical protein